jgi:hypothetical protein
MRCAIILAVGLLLLARPSVAQVTGSIRGVIVEAEGGAPVAEVSVRLQSTGAVTTTDGSGRFAFDSVSEGDQELYVSVVNFLLITRRLHVDAGRPSEVSIALTQGSGTFAETVSVVGVGPSAADTPVESRVRGTELQQLSGLLANDPLRAVQAMPGVTTGDDFRSEFAVRGAGPRQTGFILDGISTAFLLHTVQQVNDAGSIAMVNGEVLDDVSLRSGAYPQYFGNRNGAEVEFQMREGARDHARAHVSVSAVDASAVAEGPLGRAARGSWLASIRKSYLDLVLNRLYPQQTVNFGFVDAQTKLAWDLNAHQRLEFSSTAGRSRLGLASDDVSNPADLRDALSESALAVLAWRITPTPRVGLTQRIAVAANTFRNTSREGPVLDDGATREVIYRAEARSTPWPQLTVSSGAEMRWTDAAGGEQRFSGSALVTRERYDAASTRAGAYAGLQLRAKGATVSPGIRVDRWSLIDTTAASPWTQFTVPVGKGLAIRGGAGIYRQAPDTAQVLGVRGSTGLRAGRATDVDLGIEGRPRPHFHWQVTAYNREDRDWLRLPGAEPRLVGGTLIGASVTSHWTDALDGHARGVELLLERRAERGVSGWVSYALGYNRYTDRQTGERFWGDYDQRHTFNAFGTYRLSDRTSLSARFRMGSNTPATGYWTERDGLYYVSSTRNDLRVPGYSRLDLRGNRTFTRQRGRLTLYVEMLNVLARDNQRFLPPAVTRRTLEATGIFESMLPFVPSAGLMLEF